MTKRDAIKAMCENQKMRHKKYPMSFFDMDKSCNVRGHGVDTHDYCNINHIDYPNEGWEVYEEPELESVPKCCGNCDRWNTEAFKYNIDDTLRCECDVDGHWLRRVDECGKWKEIRR